MYLNKVQLIGNLTRDPELKALPSGSNVVNFSIATNRTWKDANGAKQEAVEYHNVVFYGKQADVIAQWCTKGQQLLVEGRLTTRSWEKDGAKQYRTEIVGEQFQFGRKAGEGTGGGKKEYDGTASDDEFDNYGKPPAAKKTARKTSPASTGVDYPSDDINPEDIPF